MIRWCAYVTILFVSAGLYQVARAQLPDYHVKMLTEQQGLQPAEFISISRDTDGFLWLLSPTRIQRYDGQVTRVFPVPPHPQEVFVDRDGSVWIISRHEIQQFVNALTGFRRVASAPDTTRMICLFYAQE